MISGWCGQRGKPNCKACRSELCACRCHGSNPAQHKGIRDGNRTPERVESGAVSGPESAGTDRGLDRLSRSQS